MGDYSDSLNEKAIVHSKVSLEATFKYTADGSVGLLTGKKVYVALSRGVLYRGTSDDVMVPWLTKVLAFMGMTDVQYFYVEGLALSEKHTVAFCVLTPGFTRYKSPPCGAQDSEYCFSIHISTSLNLRAEKALT